MTSKLIKNLLNQITLENIEIASIRDNKKRWEIPASILYAKCKLNMIDEDIHKIICNANTPQNACKQIVDLANQRGGSDNISLIVLSPNNEDVISDESPTVINNKNLEK